jgi:hypothetical protein
VARKNKSKDKFEIQTIKDTNETVINEPIKPPLSDIDNPALSSIENNLDLEVVLIELNDELLIRPTGNWYAVAEAVVGLAHRRTEPPLPCQDAFSLSTKPRVSLLVADGAGSASVSEIGANAVVNACQRLLDTFDDQVSELLDCENEPDTMITKRFALRLVKHAMGTLEDISKQYRREIRDFRCTLLILVMGKERLLWIKVGDGALVIEEKGKLRTLGEVGKGEFANQTTFIDDKLMPDSVQFGTASSIYVTGLAAMSDGAAEKLVANDGSRVAGRMTEFFIQLRKNSLNRTQITDFLHDKEAWRGTSGDDKCLALAARQ